MPTNKPVLLTAIRLTGFTGQKTDRSASRELTATKGASSDSAAVIKRIVSKEFTDPVKSIEGEIRRTLYTYGLATGITGCYMIRADKREAFEKKVNDLFRDRENAVDDMMHAYDGERIKRRETMGELFNASDYPLPSQLSHKFSAKLIYMPLPTAEASGFDDPAIIQSITEARKLVLETAHKEAWSRIADSAADIIKRLEGYTPATGKTKATGKFRVSLVDSLKIMIQTLENLNIWDDNDMKTCLDTLKTEIAGVAIEVLQENDKIRFQAIAAAKGVLKASLQSATTEPKPEPAPEPAPAEPKPKPEPAPELQETTSDKINMDELLAD
jgi:hypothetical protein